MFRIMTVFGIRPDFIRASVLLKKLAAHPKAGLLFVYTGQHYDENLKGIFFNELGIPEPQYDLDTKAGSHPQQHAKLIEQLEKTIEIAKPDVVVFLGDANAVIGCIAPLKMGVPIAHIEAGMRSYDWKMPEERNRVIIDRVSDVLYCYQEDYKYRLIQEGIDPDKIVVTGNTICDVLDEHKDEFWWPGQKFKSVSCYPPLEDLTKMVNGVELERKKFALMTLHRDEHMRNEELTKRILLEVNRWAEDNKMPVVLPVMPRLQEILDKELLNLSSFIFTKPLGFFEFVQLEKGAAIEFTDSGTNQEVSAIVGTPCVVTRRSTERPETFESNITVMTEDKIYEAADYVIGRKKNPDFTLRKYSKDSLDPYDKTPGAADIIIEDLMDRLKNGFTKHQPPVNNFMARNWQTFGGQY